MAMGIITGIINSIIGFSIMLDQELFHHPKICRYAGNMLKKGYSMILLGVFLAVIPCVPLTSFFTQVMVERRGALLGALEGIIFGAGITLSAPFWLVSIFSGSVPAKILQNRRFSRAFKIICGTILVVIGIKYITAVI